MSPETEQGVEEQTVRHKQNTTGSVQTHTNTRMEGVQTSYGLVSGSVYGLALGEGFSNLKLQKSPRNVNTTAQRLRLVCKTVQAISIQFKHAS